MPDRQKSDKPKSEKSLQTSIRLTEDMMERLLQEAKRQRMETGDNITVPELFRRYAAGLPPVKKRSS